MRINPVNIKQSYMQSSSSKSVAFKAKLEATPAAKRALKAGMEEFGPINFRAVFVGYKKSIEKATKDIKGIIRLKMDKYSSESPILAYITPEGKYLQKEEPIEINAYQILSDKILVALKPRQFVEPPKHFAEQFTIAGAADTMAHNGYGVDELNPFYTLYKKLYMD